MGEKWVCHDCGQKLEVGVKLSAPPTHKCPRHVNKTRVMEKVESKKKPPTE